MVLLSEIEPYRVYDVVTSRYHAEQTAHIPPGHLTFVMQGRGGGISLMLVGPPACQNCTQCLRSAYGVPTGRECLLRSV